MKALILLCALALTGCASFQTASAVVTVDSIADASKGPTNFVIVPASDKMDASDLHFKEYAVYTARALEAKGFQHETDPSKNHLTVTLDYGVGSPVQQTITRQNPVYAPSVTTTETNKWGHVVHESTTSVNGPVAYQTSYDQITNYDKFITVTGYEDVNKKRVMRWQTKIDSEDQSTDLRRMFPVMLRGALTHLSENTGAQRTRLVSIAGDDKGFCYIRFGERCDLATGQPKEDGELKLQVAE